MTQPIDVPVVQSPRSLSYPFLKLRDTDWTALVVLICITLLVTVVLGALGLFSMLVITGLLMWPMLWGKRYYEWFLKLVNLWIRYVQRDIIWESKEAAQLDADSRKAPAWLLRFIRQRKPYPLRADKIHDIGVIYNEPRKTYALLIGSDGSDIAAMNIHDQYRRQTMIADTIQRIASYEGLRVEIGFNLRRRPYSISELDVSFDKNAQPDIFAPAGLIPMKETGQGIAELYENKLIDRTELRRMRLHQVMLESRVEASDHGSDVEMVTVVTISRSRRLQEAAKGKKPVSKQELQRERVYQLGQEICQGLKAATVKDPVIFSQSDCEDYLAAALDVVNLTEYRAAKAAHIAQGGMGSTLYQPRSLMKVHNDMCIIDDTGHAVVRVTRLPTYIEPNLMPLLFSELNVRWPSRSLVSEASTGDFEYFTTGWLAALFDGILDAFGGLRTGPKTRMKKEYLDETQERIAAQGHAEYFNIYISAANTDQEQLEDDVDEIIRTINAHGGRAERVTGRCRQIYAALMAATGIALL